MEYKAQINFDDHCSAQVCRGGERNSQELTDEALPAPILAKITIADHTTTVVVGALEKPKDMRATALVIFKGGAFVSS